MGRQFRSSRQIGPGGGSGNFREFVGPNVVSSSSVVRVGIPNYGVTDVSTWTAGDYVMDAPNTGCIKTLVSASTNPAGLRNIFLSSDASVTILNMNKTTGASGNTQIGFEASTLDTCITLMGLNSTHWMVVSVHPALNSTGTHILST